MAEPVRHDLCSIAARESPYAGILEKRPADGWVLIVCRAAELQMRDRQAREYLLVQRAFEHHALARHPFGDHARSVAPGRAHAVQLRFAPLVDECRAIGGDALDASRRVKAGSARPGQNGPRAIRYCRSRERPPGWVATNGPEHA